jgi:hypothetical protein
VVFILLITVVIRPNSSLAQEQTIDSFKKVLPGLRDTGRVDCLNAIGQQYFIMSQIDSATRFVQLAYEESRQLNYIQRVQKYVKHAPSLTPAAAVAKHW